MPMLDARDPAFTQQYPNGCHTYDARGRRIPFVQVCNTETGEVVRFVPTADEESIRCVRGGSPWRRHGFWPAPLRVVPLGGPVPAGVPCRVGDGAREQRVDITAAEIYARARAKEQRVDSAEAPARPSLVPLP